MAAHRNLEVEGYQFKALQPAGEKQDEQDENHQARATTHVMVAGAEAVTATTEEENNEQDDKDVHGIVYCILRSREVSGVNCRSINTLRENRELGLLGVHPRHQPE